MPRFPLPSNLAFSFASEAESAGYVTSGLDARWEADEGVANPGTSSMTWTDQEGALVLPTFNSSVPSIVASNGTKSAVLIEADEGFRLIGPTGLPSGAANRTMMIAWRTLGEGEFGGAGYGTNTADQSFKLVASTAENLTVTVHLTDIEGSQSTGGWNILGATYDGTRVRLLEGETETNFADRTLNTQLTQFDVGLSFGSLTTPCEIGAIFVWDKVLSAAEITQMVNYLSERYVGVVTAPTSVTFGDSTPSLPENSPIGTLVTSISADGDNPVLSLATNGEGKFGISGTNVVIQQALDFETATSHDFAVRATNSAGSATSATATLTVTDVVEGGGPAVPDADSTAASVSALNTLLDSWAGDWNGTVPGGKTASDPRYIDLADGAHSGTVGFTSGATRTFPQRVYVRGTTRTQPFGATFGGFTIRKLSNFELQFIDTTGKVEIQQNECNNCALRYCSIDRGVSSFNNGSIGVQWLGNDNISIIDCFIRGFRTGLQYFGGSHNATIENNVFDYCVDDIKQSDSDNAVISGNWWSRNKILPGTPTTLHYDGLQDQSFLGDNYVLSGMFIRGNILFKADRDGKTNQSTYLEPGSAFNITMVEGIHVSPQHGQKINTKVGGGNNVSTNNLVLNPPDSTQTTVVTAQDGSQFSFKDENVVVAFASVPGSGGAGPNGIEMGVPGSGSIVRPTTYDDLYDVHFVTQIRTGGPFSQLLPKVASRLHWDHADPTGPFTRFKEIFIDGLHPGNSLNPYLATQWDTIWNFDGGVTS